MEVPPLRQENYDKLPDKKVYGCRGERFWLADRVGHKMCDRLTYWLRVTELQMSVSAWVAFATKRQKNEVKVQSVTQ